MQGKCDRINNIDDLANRVLGRLTHRDRIIVAVAGPPGSGKSTLSKKLLQAINLISGQDIVAIVPMDGFHLDNTELDRRGLRRRKGAPETFDSNGFINLLNTLKKAAGKVSVPVFDRRNDCVVDAGATVQKHHRVVLAEGNYLLLNVDPWAKLHDVFEYTVFLDPGREILEKRLVRRWLQLGFAQDEARERALLNDIPNARLVCEKSCTADITLSVIN